MPRITISLLAVFVLTGCTMGPDYKAPAIEIPKTWGVAIHAGSSASAPWAGWWKSFDDPTLDQLVAQALDQNLDIALQTARVEEYRARLGLARSERWPSLNAQANASRERTPSTVNPIPGAGASTDNLFAVAGVLDYEIDLWGRLAREREAASALLDQNLFAREAVRLEVATQVVATYFDLKAATRQVEITEETIASRQASLRLQEIRREAGDVDHFTLQQARSELEAAKAELPMRIQRQQTLQGALGVLVGMSPNALWNELLWDFGTQTAPARSQPVPDFLPSELLERRPDIRAAESALIAANAGIGVAQAARLPRLNLSAMAGTLATGSGDLFSSESAAWSVAGGVAGPLWDFGRSRSRVETAEAIAAQAEALYRQTVQQAFNDVRNALIVYERSGERSEATQRLVDALEENRALAQVRYDEGFISFLNLLDVERALLTARIALEEARRDQLAATATLFKALGGSWDDLRG